MPLTYLAAIHPETGAVVARGSKDDYGYTYAAISPDGRDASFSRDRGNAAYAAAKMAPGSRVAETFAVDAKTYRFVKANGRMPAPEIAEGEAKFVAVIGSNGAASWAPAPSDLDDDEMPGADDPMWTDADPLDPAALAARIAQAEAEGAAIADAEMAAKGFPPIAVPPTTEVYGALQQAFDHFNARLWGGALPACLVTLQRKDHRTGGYFWAERFAAGEGEKVDEIAMNPQHFGRTTEETLSTLVHEMAHLWQHHFGAKKSRAGYHNHEWAAEMDRIGLPPHAADGSGKRVGQKMTHSIAPNGAFAVACADLLADGAFALRWREVVDAVRAKEPKKPTRAKFTCPDCEANAWAKPSAKLICGECEVRMTCGAAGEEEGE